MTIRKMVTLRHAHLPRVLMNCILSLLSFLQPINSWGCQSNCEGCQQTPRAGLRWMERYIFLSLFCSLNVFPKEKNQKAEDDHNKINAWQVTE